MYKNFREMTPDRLNELDWMCVQVEALIVRPGAYRLYRCPPFTGNEQSAPQGERICPIEREKAVAEALFPCALYGMEPDRW